MSVTLRQVVEAVIDRLNEEIDWQKLAEEVPQIKGGSLLITIEGEPVGSWGLYVDFKENRLRMVNPEMIPDPLARANVHHSVAWDLLTRRRTEAQMLGMLMAHQMDGLVRFQTRDGKTLYHARVLVFLWSLLQQIALGEG